MSLEGGDFYRETSRARTKYSESGWLSATGDIQTGEIIVAVGPAVIYGDRCLVVAVYHIAKGSECDRVKGRSRQEPFGQCASPFGDSKEAEPAEAPIRYQVQANVRNGAGLRKLMLEVVLLIGMEWLLR